MVVLSWKGRNIMRTKSGIKADLHPDLVGGNVIIEAKGGLPSANKVRTALGQLLSYREHEPYFKVGFLFPKIWLEAEDLQKEFEVLRKHDIILLPL
jgi:hypothetical protein